MKPDSPVGYRGEFRPIATNVPGLRVCEHLPRIARHADKLAVLRAMTHDDVNHTTATHYLLTGKPSPRLTAALADDWPSYGGVMAKLGRGRGPLPPFVSMMPKVPGDGAALRRAVARPGRGLAGAGLRPAAHRRRTPAGRTTRSASSACPPRCRCRGRAAGRSCWADSTPSAGAMEASAELATSDALRQRAFSLLADRRAVEAFDLTREPLAVRERYGMNIHGQAVLQARRLVEAGVPLVTVFWQNDGIKNVSVYWDTHSRNFIDLKTRLCPVADQAFAALLEDLDQRGMLDETLVVWTGEMGRTPRVGQSVPGGAGRGRRRPRPLGEGVHERPGRRRHQGRRRPRRERPLRRRTRLQPDHAARPGGDGVSLPRRRSAHAVDRQARPADRAVRGDADRRRSSDNETAVRASPLRRPDLPLDPPVGDQPHRRDDAIDRTRDPGVDERHPDGRPRTERATATP